MWLCGVNDEANNDASNYVNAYNDASNYVDVNNDANDYVGASDDVSDGWWLCLWQWECLCKIMDL
jgi:hypothetical protein